MGSFPLGALRRPPRPSFRGLEAGEAGIRCDVSLFARSVVRLFLVVLPALVAGLLWARVGPPGGPSAPVAGAAVPSRATSSLPEQAGAFVWKRDCASCHGDRGEGSQEGPPLIGVGTAAVDFMVRTGRMPRPIDAPGRPKLPDPAYDPATIEALVAFTAPFVAGGPAVPTSLDVASAAVPAGGELYRLQCAACHQVAGQGAVLAYGAQAPDLMGVEPIEVVEAIRVGPGSMPAFPETAIDRSEAEAIAAFVQRLQDPDDRGGLSLWHLGPVPEGMVAWVVGLGGALAFCRWLGSRRRSGSP